MVQTIVSNGIELLNANNYNVKLNIIYPTLGVNPLEFSSGIAVVNTIGNNVSCNIVNGDGSYPLSWQSSIYSSFNNNYLFKCNDINGTTDGFQFYGLNAGLLQSNNIYDHYNGLHVSLASTMGKQDHQGNLWLGTYANLAAWHQNSLAAFLQPIIYDPLSFNFPLNKPLIYTPPVWFTTLPAGTDSDCNH